MRRYYGESIGRKTYIGDDMTAALAALVVALLAVLFNL
jgi:hypothetical protein